MSPDLSPVARFEKTHTSKCLRAMRRRRLTRANTVRCHCSEANDRSTSTSDGSQSPVASSCPQKCLQRVQQRAVGGSRMKRDSAREPDEYDTMALVEPPGQRQMVVAVVGGDCIATGKQLG